MKRTALALALAIVFIISFPVHAVELHHDDEAPYRFYRVAGYEMPKEVSMFLQECLAQEGIEWWLPYAACQAYQESNFDVWQVTIYPSGVDCGLFQFREQFWPDHEAMAGYYGDLMDWRVQCRVYARIIAQRLRSGRTISEVISDWYTGGYDGYCQEYVDEVMQWSDRLEAYR